MAKIPTITIYMDKNCTLCGKAGAGSAGYCLACIAKGIKEGKYDHIIKPIRDTVKRLKPLSKP